MPAPRRRRAAALVTGAAGVALAAVGIRLLTRPRAGWFAYAPLSGQTYQPGVPPAGVVCLVAGGLVVGAGVWLALRRR